VSISRVMLAAAFGLSLFTGANAAQAETTYEVTITNITRGQTFTPQLIVTHRRTVSLFTAGEPASGGLELLAEGGDTSGVVGELAEAGARQSASDTVPGLLGPGQSVTHTIAAGRNQPLFSMAAMLIPTNDTFVALNGVRLPRTSATFTAIAYDSGTEANDQNCRNIPGPRCGGEGFSPGPNEGDEGFVYVSNGFHDLGTGTRRGGEVLGPLVYDWRNPVAQVTITRVD